MFSDHQRALHIYDKRPAEIDFLIHTNMTVYAEYQASLPIHCTSSCATKRTNKQTKM